MIIEIQNKHSYLEKITFIMPAIIYRDSFFEIHILYAWSPS